MLPGLAVTNPHASRRIRAAVLSVKIEPLKCDFNGPVEKVQWLRALAEDPVPTWHSQLPVTPALGYPLSSFNLSGHHAGICTHTHACRPGTHPHA